MTLMTERPTISGTEPHSFEDLLDALDKLIVPDGYKAEIIRASIVLSPFSKAYYTRVMRLVCQQLESYLPTGHTIERAPNLFVFPEGERAYGPDVYAADDRVFDADSNHLDGDALSFVAELTSSSTRDNDLTDKVLVYGKAGVPVYLLLDMQEKQATVFSTPSAKGYESRCTVPFGEDLAIPAPFDCTLDTGGFLTAVTKNSAP
ncbi:Uma2 family endonuclease [Streptomyces sp. NPDC001137]|uniref:Uma2 family endonuclease n=1 Tax=Streptomyces sp. NPDC001137 TaxID=3154378 RepID=UPI0033201319